jgi:hypothetical protein
LLSADIEAWRLKRAYLHRTKSFIGIHGTQQAWQVRTR